MSLWKAFQALLPQTPLLIGTVAIVHGDGSVTITTLSGSPQRVLGDASLGQRIFAQDGKVIGPAPTLPVIEVDI